MKLPKLNSVIEKKITKAFFGSSVSTLAKVVSSIILSKIIAEKLGPSGLGVVGQLTSFVSIVLLISTGGFQNAIIKFTAVLNNKSEQDLSNFLKPSLKLIFIISSICGIIILLLANFFSCHLFNTKEFAYIFYALGFTIVLYSFNVFVTSFLNGISNFRLFSIVNVSNSIFSLIVSFILIYYQGLAGALLSVVLSQTLIFAASFKILQHYLHLFRNFFRASITKDLAAKLLPYVKMTLISTILLPISQIIIRNLIAKDLGSFEMGIWEAINRISGIYLLVIINVMLVYYLPRLAVVEQKSEALKEFKKGILFFGAILLLIGASVFLLRLFIIKVFLSSSFNSVESLIIPQVISDFFKVLFYVFAYFSIAKSLTNYYIISELLFFILLIILSFYLVPLWGVRGAIYASAIVNFLAFIIHLFFIGKLYFKKRNIITMFLFQNN